MPLAEHLKQVSILPGVGGDVMLPVHTFIQLLRLEQQIMENNQSPPLRLLDKSDLEEEDFISSAEVSDCTSEDEDEDDSVPSLRRRNPQRQSRNRRMASKPSLQTPSKTPKKTVRLFWVCLPVTCPSCMV